MVTINPTAGRPGVIRSGRGTLPPRQAMRRVGRRLRPMAEDLEGRTLLSVGLDPTWGFGGVSTLNVPPNTASNSYLEIFNSIALQNGQVVELGTLTNTPTASGSTATTNLIVSRLNTDGFLDPTFGSGGTETIPLTFGSVTYTVQSADDIAVQSNGSVDVLATVIPSGSSSTDFLVVQLTANGSIDTTFGTSGFQLISFGTGSSPASANALALAIGPDGKIVAAGSTTTSAGTFFAVARLNTNGTLDTSFNGNGTATVDFNVGGSSGEYDQANAVVVQPDDAIVVVGTAYLPTSGTRFTIGSPSDVAVARINTNGTLDTSFNGTGTLAFNEDLGGSTSSDVASAVILEGTQIVIVGTSTQIFPSGSGFASNVYALTVTRLNSDGAVDTTFDGSGKFVLAFNQAGTTFDTSASSVIDLPDGSLLVGGYASEQNGAGGSSGGLLLTLTPSGGLDTTFGTDGEAVIPEPVESRMLMQSDGKLIFRAGDNVVARTTAPAPQVASTAPIVTGSGKKAKAMGVTITFNTGINATLASNVSSYLVRPMKGRRAIRIKKGGVSYNATTRTLTIKFAAKNPLGNGFQVLITPGAIIGADAQTLSTNIILIPPPTT